LLLAAGLQLVYFDEPTPVGGEATKTERYRRSPYFHIMEWQKLEMACRNRTALQPSQTN